MKILIFGASGMVGQGVLRECLAAWDVDEVVVIGRSALAQTHPKLRQVVTADVAGLAPHAAAMAGADACFFCLGVSSSGMDEARYTELTHTLTLRAAKVLAGQSPGMTFIYVSGAGTDSTERGRSMWARVKGRTENDLRRLPFAHVCLFRPGLIVPLDGIVSKTRAYRLIYTFFRPLLSLTLLLAPNALLTTRKMGLAMLGAVRTGAAGVFESPDIAALARSA